MFRTRFTAPVWAAAVLLAPSAMASIAFSGDVGASSESTGSTYSGTLDYDHIGGSVGQLTITITNDTPALIGGRLTAVVFRFDSLDGAASTLLMAGYTADSITAALTAGDLTLLQHTGLLSVQLQAPGTTLTPPMKGTP